MSIGVISFSFLAGVLNIGVVISLSLLYFIYLYLPFTIPLTVTDPNASDLSRSLLNYSA